MNKKFIYFANGLGANLTSRATAQEASKLVGVVPVTKNTTRAYFENNLGEWDDGSSRDYIEFQHDDTTNTTGHRCKDIGKAMAIACNAGPHMGGMTDFVDLDNSIYLENLSFVTNVFIIYQTA